MTTKPPQLGKPETGPSVTAVIPVYNNTDTIVPLLDSLEKQIVRTDEVVVVDDCSTDGTEDLAKGHILNPRVVKTEQNSGPSVARNLGAENAESEVILFLDSDVVLDTRVVSEVKAVFCDPKVTTINGMMKCEPLNRGWAALYKCLVECAWGDFIDQWDTSPTCFNTRIGAIRRKVFHEIGGFDPKYKKAIIEDHEFGQRLTQKYEILFDKNLQAYHHFSGLAETIRNYWTRTQALLEMMWATSGTRTDKGGASVASAIEFLLGTVFLTSLALITWIGPVVPLLLLIMFGVVSFKSLKYCLMRKGPVFYLYSVLLHSIYGFVVTLTGIRALLLYKLFRRGEQ